MAIQRAFKPIFKGAIRWEYKSWDFHYRSTVRYNDHTFSPAAYTLNVTDNFFNQDFLNTTTDTLQVKVKGGCGNIIADSASFTVRSLGSGQLLYTEAYTTDASGVSTLILTCT
jgi:hypothetical protein